MPLLEATGLATDTAQFVDLAELGDALSRRGANHRIAVSVPCDSDADALVQAAGSADLIGIAYDKTGDGRVFSLAQTLRQRGYRGIIRAQGPMIPDQFAFALACGIDQVEIADDHLARQPVEQWIEAAATISRTYVGQDGIFARRARARGAA